MRQQGINRNLKAICSLIIALAAEGGVGKSKVDGTSNFTKLIGLTEHIVPAPKREKESEREGECS